MLLGQEVRVSNVWVTNASFRTLHIAKMIPMTTTRSCVLEDIVKSLCTRRGDDVSVISAR